MNLRRMKASIRSYLTDRFLLRVRDRERFCRHEFFFNAFKALSFNGIDGDYLEFGSHGGTTFALAYREARRHGHPAKLWAFDSFQGFPPPEGARDEHPRWKQGAMEMSLERFHRACALNGVPRTAYQVVAGFYDQTLPALGSGDAPSNVALAYIDCDLYSSTRTVLEFLMPRLKHGMILGLDDYFCWSASQISGERRAMLEAFEGHPRWALLPYRAFGWHGQSFVVEDRACRLSGLRDR